MKRILTLVAIAAFLTAPVSAQTLLQNYQPGFRLINGSQLNLMVAAVNNLQGTGTPANVTAKNLVINNSTGNATPPTQTAGTNLQIVGANASNSRVELIAYGGVPLYSARRADGTIAAPTAIQSADQLGSFNFFGYTGSAFAGPAAHYAGYATETWTPTANGSKIVFATTPNTTTTLTDAVTIGQDQTLTVVGAISGPSASVTGALTARSGTATPAAASAVPALSFGSAGIGIYWGTGTPTISAVKGSLYIQTDGSSSSTRMFINNGTTTWIAVTTAS